MSFPRLPRFKRAEVPAIDITDRDREIIRYIHQHRFLRSSDLAILAGGSRQQVLRRLQLLYHHNYVERPRCQLDFYYKSGSREIVYGLGDKGAALLKQEGVPIFPLRWSEKNRAVGRVQLEHWLMVSEIMVAIEVACRREGISFLTEAEIGTHGSALSKAELDVGGQTFGVQPDRVFALDVPKSNGGKERLVFFLEADRGTMPVTRTDLSQTSMYRKLLAYEAAWSGGILNARFAIRRFRVVVVTTGPDRLATLLHACATLKRGHGLFLFGERDRARKNDVFGPIWRDGKGESANLVA